MAKPAKSKSDLLANMEDDIKQFWKALSGTLRAAPGAITQRARQIRRAAQGAGDQQPASPAARD